MRQGWIAVFLLVLLGLSLYYDRPLHQPVSVDGLVVRSEDGARAEITRGGFTYRIFSDKAVYLQGEPIQLRAELVYEGPEPYTELRFGSAPFRFELEDRLRGLSYRCDTEETEGTTTLLRAVPLSAAFDQPAMPVEGGQEEGRLGLAPQAFPEGLYVVEGQTEFDELKHDGRGKDLPEWKLHARIQFQVLGQGEAGGL